MHPYYWGINWQMYGTVAWTVSNVGDVDYLETNLNVKDSATGACVGEDNHSCYNCEWSWAYDNVPQVAGYYNFQETHTAYGPYLYEIRTYNKVWVE